eukprot:6355785-Pyramimonas_sp.AAC.1
MVPPVPAILIPSTCLAVSRLLLVSSSSSWDVGRRPEPRAVLLSFSEKARGASLAPVPGQGTPSSALTHRSVRILGESEAPRPIQAAK